MEGLSSGSPDSARAAWGMNNASVDRAWALRRGGGTGACRGSVCGPQPCFHRAMATP